MQSQSILMVKRRLTRPLGALAVAAMLAGVSLERTGRDHRRGSRQTGRGARAA